MREKEPQFFRDVEKEGKNSSKEFKQSEGYNKEIADRYYEETKKYIEEHHLPPTTEWPIMLDWIDFSLSSKEESKEKKLEGKKILDAGCGFGYEANYLHQKGVEVFGFDASQRFIELAKKDYPALRENFSVGDVRNLPYEDNSFDFIISKRVIHNLPTRDIEKAYNEFHRCLKEKGILIFSIQNPLGPLALKSKKCGEKESRVKLYHKAETKEPVHDLEDFLSKEVSNFSKYFDFQDMKMDSDDHTAETPEWFLIKARKRQKENKEK